MMDFGFEGIYVEVVEVSSGFGVEIAADSTFRGILLQVGGVENGPVVISEPICFRLHGGRDTRWQSKTMLNRLSLHRPPPAVTRLRRLVPVVRILVRVSFQPSAPSSDLPPRAGCPHGDRDFGRDIFRGGCE
jgi:hypothetical protein